MWRKVSVRIPCTLLVGMQISTATVEKHTEVPRKTRSRSAQVPARPAPEDRDVHVYSKAITEVPTLQHTHNSKDGIH